MDAGPSPAATPQPQKQEAQARLRRSFSAGDAELPALRDPHDELAQMRLRDERRLAHERMQRPKIPGEKGLENPVGANNCFLNVVLQALWHLASFRSAFLDVRNHACLSPPGSNRCLFCALKVLFHRYRVEECQHLPPKDVREAISHIFRDRNRFQLNQMEDAAELFEELLSELHSSFTEHEVCTPVCCAHSAFSSDILEAIRQCSCGFEPPLLTYRTYVQWIPAAILCRPQGERERDHAPHNERQEAPRTGSPPADHPVTRAPPPTPQHHTVAAGDVLGDFPGINAPIDEPTVVASHRGLQVIELTQEEMLAQIAADQETPWPFAGIAVPAIPPAEFLQNALPPFQIPETVVASEKADDSTREPLRRFLAAPGFPYLPQFFPELNSVVVPPWLQGYPIKSPPSGPSPVQPVANLAIPKTEMGHPSAGVQAHVHANSSAVVISQPAGRSTNVSPRQHNLMNGNNQNRVVTATYQRQVQAYKARKQKLRWKLPPSQPLAAVHKVPRPNSGNPVGPPPRHPGTQQNTPLWQQAAARHTAAMATTLQATPAYRSEFGLSSGLFDAARAPKNPNNKAGNGRVRSSSHNVALPLWQAFKPQSTASGASPAPPAITGATGDKARDRVQSGGYGPPPAVVDTFFERCFSQYQEQEAKFCDKCQQPLPVDRFVLTVPRVLTIGMIWDKEVDLPREELVAVNRTIKDRIDLSQLVRIPGVTTPQPAMLLGLICFYGRHYISYFLNIPLNKWVFFDDSTVRAIGDFRAVKNHMDSGRYRPLLLFYHIPGQHAGPVAAAPAAAGPPHIPSSSGYGNFANRISCSIM